MCRLAGFTLTVCHHYRDARRTRRLAMRPQPTASEINRADQRHQTAVGVTDLAACYRPESVEIEAERTKITVVEHDVGVLAPLWSAVPEDNAPVGPPRRVRYIPVLSQVERRARLKAHA